MVWPITEDIKTSDHWPLTKDKARFQGDGVAVVVGESRGLADDAAEAVDVEYEQLPAVLDIEDAVKDGAPLVHDELGTNAVVHWSHGGGGDQSVFDSAPVQLQLRYEAPRTTPSPSSRAARSRPPVPSIGEFTLWTSTQIPHIARVTLSGTTGIPEHKLRIVAPDVGGSFGGQAERLRRGGALPRARPKTGRPVKWIESRSENYAVTIHGRGVIHDIEVAATEEGKILGFRVKELCDMGAYFQLLTPGIPELGGWVYMGPYDTQAYWYEFTGIMTNMTPDGRRARRRPARGDVRPRTCGRRARATLGKDPAEVRRINFVAEVTRGPKPSLMGLNDRLGATTCRRSSGRSSWRSTTSTARSRRRGARAETSSRSGSGSRATSRCAGSRHQTSWAPSGTRREAGMRRRCGANRAARSPSTSGRRRTVRATTPPGRRSRPTSSA